MDQSKFRLRLGALDGGGLSPRLLSVIKDAVAVDPAQFVYIPPEQAITNQLNEVHARRVLHGVGLCTRVFDLVGVAEGKAILTKIKSSDEDGVRRPHCRIFDDIYVPLVCLPEPCPLASTFLAAGIGNNLVSRALGSPLADRIYIDAGYVLRVRVEADGFHDDELGPSKTREGVQQAREMRRSLYAIACPISEWRLGQWRNAGVETTDDG
ncbi:polymerase III polypeptide H [Epithele typhae]|uniref:polymerase III polypeptide H n=1 Tax=Epithele typhae TaxID=378194 RepID=UPI002008C0BB|nr:polymerase III polypeptide H [Epithele typhae]KAH9910356.1 polymerase III polypeptide H [Epithele typhae]